MITPLLLPRRSGRVAFAIVAVSVLAASNAPAQTLAEPGAAVSLKVPRAVLAPAPRRWLLDTRETYLLDVTREGPHFVVGGTPDWQARGFPSLMALTVGRTSSRDGWSTIELRSDTAIVRVRFPARAGNAEELLRAIAVRGAPDGPEATAYLDVAFEQLAHAWFGPSPWVTEAIRLALVRLAYRAGGHVSYGGAVYRDRRYLVATIGGLPAVFPGTQPNVLGRVSRLLNDRVLAEVKATWQVVAAEPEIDGIKIDARLPHRTSWEVASPMTTGDHLEWYAPASLLGRFAHDDITSQALVDGSAILVNDLRVSLSLATWR